MFNGEHFKLSTNSENNVLKKKKCKPEPKVTNSNNIVIPHNFLFSYLFISVLSIIIILCWSTAGETCTSSWAEPTEPHRPSDPHWTRPTGGPTGKRLVTNEMVVVGDVICLLSPRGRATCPWSSYCGSLSNDSSIGVQNINPVSHPTTHSIPVMPNTTWLNPHKGRKRGVAPTIPQSFIQSLRPIQWLNPLMTNRLRWMLMFHIFNVNILSCT